MLANLYGPKSGGLKTTLNELSAQYEKLGHQVLIIVPGECDQVSKNGLITKVEIKSPLLPLTGGYRAIFNLIKTVDILKSYQPDVCEFSDRSSLQFVALWCKIHKIPSIFFAHERLDGVFKTFFPGLPFMKLISKFLNRITNLIYKNIVATTVFAAEEFFQIKSKKVSKIPLGVDLKTFTPELVRKPDENSFNGYLVTATRQSKEKDPGLILDIARALKERNIEFPIIVYGEGPELFKLQQKAHLEKLNIFYLGYIRDRKLLAERIANADIYLAPGPIETFGLAALEALACGTPVICRKSSALAEIVIEGTGFALERNPNLWVNAILALTSGDRSVLRVNARKRAENFDWSIRALNLVAIHGNNLKLSVTIPDAPILVK